VAHDGHLLDDDDLETFREAADPHLAEELQTDTFRVIEWLTKRLQTLVDTTESESLAIGDLSLHPKDVAAVALGESSRARPLRAGDVKDKRSRDRLSRELAGGLLLVDVRLGGLERGLLDAGSTEASDVTELEGDERVVPFRVRHVTNGDEPVSADFRIEARIAVDTKEDDEKAWLVIESLLSEAAESENGRSAGAKRAQMLDEHQSWTEGAASEIAKRLDLPGAYVEMLKLAARLHDEGKRAARWQRAFRAANDGVYAKTTSRPNLKLLSGYRHELGSLPYAERHVGVNGLEPSLRELCLHLVAAHHGQARPSIRTDGAEEPPTRLAQRAREIALRFASLEQRWGPWGLAWWETLLRAADQRASQRNDEGGGHG
jgi:CRISPR-associated endonuclease/helicase Cas3